MTVIPKLSAFTVDDFEDVTLGPISCGPPRVSIKGGYGCKANPIVSKSGRVIAVDIIKLGVNYSQYDTVCLINDKCGSGTGCYVEPVLGEVVVTDNGDGSLTLTNGNLSSEIPGGKFDSGNLGYFDEPSEPMIPVLDNDSNPVPDGGSSMSIVDMKVMSSGSGYLSSPDGSMGGDGRVWAKKDQTIIETPIGPGVGWYPPIPPNQIVDVKKGDTIITPANAEIIEVVPSEETSEETIIRPGVPTKVESNGKITTPPLRTDVITDVSSPYPVEGEGAYEANLSLDDLIILDSGFNYTDRDELVITPSNGAEAVVKLDQVGRVVSVNITNPGEGFTDIPYVYIQSETGFNAKFQPKFSIDRMKKEVSEPTLSDKVMVVIDCTSRPPVGYLNGVPYYGPFHDHKGVRMVGAKHSSIKHATLTSRP